jgi:hypothetical protein
MEKSTVFFSSSVSESLTHPTMLNITCTFFEGVARLWRFCGVSVVLRNLRRVAPDFIDTAHNTHYGGSTGRLRSPVSPAVNLTTLSLTNGNHSDHYAVVFDFIDQPVTCAAQFNFVAVYQAG